MNRHKKRGILLNILFLLILLTISSIFIANDLDRRISSFFYNSETGWVFSGRQPWTWLHRYGHLPGILFTIFAFLLYIIGILRPRFLRVNKRHLLVFFLTTAIGSGVLVNMVLKDNWGRPRPHQIEEFNGYWEYRDLNSPGIPGKGRSFTCGHCSMGYIFLTTLFFYETSKTLAIAGGGIGLIFGGLISLSRIGQGGHFASDTLWSMGIILLTANTLSHLFLFPSEATETCKQDEKTRVKKVAKYGFIILAVAGFFSLVLSPIYNEHRQTIQMDRQTKKLFLNLNMEHYDLKVQKTKETKPFIAAEVTGRGTTATKVTHKIHQTSNPGTTCLDYSVNFEGWNFSAAVTVAIAIPHTMEVQVAKTNNCK